MATNAADVLGMPELAGCFVSPKGLTKKMTGATAAGMVAGVAGRVAASASAGRGAAPSFGAVGYVAVTAAEVAIVKGKMGALKPSVGTEVIARVRREQVASAELQPGMLKAALKIGFVDGGGWEFEVPKVHRKNAGHVVHVLNAEG
ncbi:MAG: hypothetical protein ACLQFR_20165 [Streptosporangiaceae bacterium]